MNSLPEIVEATLDARCREKRCAKEGCRLKLPSTKRIQGEARIAQLLIDLDCRHLDIRDDETICDFLYVADDNIVAVIELKTGDSKIADVQRQLQAGAKFVEQLIGSLKTQVRFRPVLGHGGRLRGQGRQKHWRRKDRGQPGQRKAEAEQIRFNDKWYQVETLRCGMNLSQVLDKARSADPAGRKT